MVAVINELLIATVGKFEISLSTHREFLGVGDRHGSPMFLFLRVMEDLTLPKQSVEFQWFETGEELPNRRGEYIGSYGRRHLFVFSEDKSDV